MKLRVWALSLLLVAPLSYASVDRGVLQFESIRSQQSEIRAAVKAANGRYKEMPQNTRGELLAKQDQLFHLMDGKQSTQDLNEDQKTEVFNTLEWIEAAINSADDERMVCERRPVLGSNRKERVCRTAGQIRAERESARERIESGEVRSSQ
ncbi:hypothetical protein [Lysobacter silvisoli]|uniref:Uncharacterized protein n=1 Tax=Lysobacter silvisoli TaxID=2293254 RepID=A0A371JYT7_9GAMM|nr:hypothetical protein [Lysobacter silvisoli]RDZ26782.1 hypothetical protein DX914_17590 [Lysobacter silvisoli]